MTDVFPDFPAQNESVAFSPIRADGVRRLEQFLARTGRHYAHHRNYDCGPERRSNVSALSPWIRHRLVTEEEVLIRVLATQGPSSADKYIQEVFWRTYFKGWLEQHPTVWTAYQRNLIGAFQRLEVDAPLQATYRDAVSGTTGLACFDHWAKELISKGYLHNHARMWLASIWIFTLRLPWELGADFFMRHLLDGDPASNTLSWRWVAGLHTKGKTYLARADNIEKYTEGRFRPLGLAKIAEPLIEYVDHQRVPIETSHAEVKYPYLLLLTEDDLAATKLLPFLPAGVVGLLATHGRSPQSVAAPVLCFAETAMTGTLAAMGGTTETTDDWGKALVDAADRLGVKTIVTGYVPIGPARTRLDKALPVLRRQGIALHSVVRRYDSTAWPFAKAGFFGLKKKIPQILRDLDLTN